MSNGFMIVSEKDWEKATSDQRDWLVFNTLQSINLRIAELEARDTYFKLCSFGGGIVGGIMVWGAYLITLAIKGG